MWSRDLSRLQLYDACWIMGNYQESEKMIQENPVWPLLPVRNYHDGFVGSLQSHHLKTRFSSVGRYENGTEQCVSIDIASPLIFFTEKLWEESAKRILEDFPHITEIEFESQTEEGIYPISFRYDLEIIKKAQQRIMRDLIRNGFSVDEFLTLETEEKKGRKEIYYHGVIDCASEKLRDAVYGSNNGDPFSFPCRKNVSFSYEECEKSFKIFDERMLTLGNQRAAYRFFEPRNRPLFEAAKTGNKKVLRDLIEKGFSINEIDPSGNTAFSLFLQYFTYYNETHDITYEDEKFLDYLYAHGANVDLFGVNEMADPPLFNAFIDRAERLFEWLTEHGADPSVQVCCDDPFDNDRSVTIQDRIDDRAEEHKGDRA